MDKEFTKTKGYEYYMRCHDGETALIITPIDILIHNNNYYKIYDGDSSNELFRYIEAEGVISSFGDSVWLFEENTPRAVNLIISAFKSKYERRKDEYSKLLDKELKYIKSMEKFIKENANGN